MSTLTGKKINETYDGLLKTNDEQPLIANPKIIQDGEGNNSSFQLGTQGAKFTGYVTIENEQPILYLIDTNNNSDYYITNKNGKFEVFDNTNSSTRLVIDSTGKVGVGNGLTVPLADFHVLGDFLVQSGYPKINFKDTTDTSHEYNIVANDGDFTIEGIFNPASVVSNLFQIQQQSSTPQYKFKLGGGSYENAYVTINPAGFSQGSMYLGGANFQPTFTVEADSVGISGHTAIKVIRHNTDTTSEDTVEFFNGTSVIGSITTTNTSTAYNTSSDYRLKENVVDIENAIERVSRLKPKRFNFIGDDKIVDGFIAHEVQEVIAEAVTGEKDGQKKRVEFDIEAEEVVDVLDEDGNVIYDPVYQGIDQAKIVPLLVAAIQEQQSVIDDLTSRIEKLEIK
mgnify:CR=1 FL=1